MARPPTSEEELAAITVGERKPHDAPVYLSPYDPRWPATFEELATRIRTALGDRAVQVEHAGSTSVPGLSSKPIIDIVLAVPDSSDEATYVPQLEPYGFALKIREPDWFEHRMLECEDPETNLHVFSAGCEEARRMLAFRDWLRSHDEDRELYERTKRELAARTWKHVQNYADAKSDVVLEIMERALR